MNARICCIVVLGFAAAARGDDSSSLPRLVEAYHRGDGAQFLDALTGIAAGAKRDLSQLTKIDEALAADGQPSLGMMALEFRARSMAASGSLLEPRPSPLEAVLLLPAAADQADQVLARVRSLPVMQPRVEPPADLRQFDPLFRQLREAQQQCGAFHDLLTQAQRLQPAARRQRGLSGRQQEAAGRDLDELAGQLKELHQQTKLRDVLLRLRRVDAAAAVLRDSTDAKQRLLAAHALDYDSSLLTKLYQSPAWKPLADSIPASPQLPEQTKSKREQARELAGSDWDVAKLLFAGIHFWVQGRYGRGWEHYGLVKPESAAAGGAGAGLYVPEQVYQSDQQGRSDYEYPDRRHHYTWAWETRRIVRLRRVQLERRPTGRKADERPQAEAPLSLAAAPVKLLRRAAGGGGGNVRASANVSRTPYFQLPYGQQYGTIDRPYSWTTADVYRRHGYQPPAEPSYQRRRAPVSSAYRASVDDYSYLPRQDPRNVRRLVGFSEYLRALECFDALAKIADPQQRSAVDELIAERDELEVETCLSRQVPRQASPLDLPAGTPRTRRGLVWLSALARSEVAAMLVAFADRGSAFVDLARPYDLEAYREVVLDATLTHYWSLKNDEGLASVAASGGDTQVLSYLRRADLAFAMLASAASLLQDGLDPPQRQQLSAWSLELKQAAGLLGRRCRALLGG